MYHFFKFIFFGDHLTFSKNPLFQQILKKDLNLKQQISFFNNNLSLITLPKYLKQQICFFNINLSL